MEYLKRKRWFWALAVGSLSLILLFPGLTSQPAAQTKKAPIVLKFGSPFPPPPEIGTVGVDRWQKEVEKRTGGRVKFESYYMGALFGPPESLDAVEKRFCDFTHFMYVYAPGKAPLGNFTVSIPFRPVDPLLNLKVVRQMWDEIPAFNEEIARFKGKTIFLQSIMTYDILSRMPIKTLGDFKGKKLGVISLWFPDYAAASGAIPVPSPMLGRYQMVERGALDGEIITLDLAHSFKHYEVSKHYTHVGLGSIVVITVTANIDAWNSLPPDIQKIMVDVGRETEVWHSNQLNIKRAELINTWEKEHKVNFYTLPKEDLTEWANRMPDTAAKFAREMEAKGWPGWKIMDRYIELCEQQGHKWPRKFAVR